jgi:hypothetical protein
MWKIVLPDITLNRTRMRTLILVFCTIPLLSGCGRSRERYLPVEGVVTMDNKPLAGVAITFEPIQTSKDPPAGRFSVGKTDESGRFRLKSPFTGQDGAIAGVHRVRITTPNQRQYTQEEIEKTRQKLIAREKAEGVANPQISDQQVIDYLDERSTDPRSLVEPIPDRYNQKTELTFEVRPDQPNVATFEIQSK